MKSIHCFSIVLFFLFLNSCFGDKVETHSSGDIVYVYKECLSAKDGYFDEMIERCVKKDMDWVLQMTAIGNVYVLKPYDKLRITDVAFLKYRVRLVDDPEIEVWVGSEFIDKKINK